VPELVLDLLKYLFLIVLWIFVARAVRAVYLELRSPTDAPVRAPAPSGRQKPAKPAKAGGKAKTPRKVVVVEGDNLRGKSFDLGNELMIGRADKCHIQLDDTYVSQVHARIFPKGENYMVEDQGSTNGTYLNRRRITAPTEVRRGDQIKIGKTVLEMRK
jgi:pSer/pThr/pTyr-binding forkhead associated (FHA) protein